MPILTFACAILCAAIGLPLSAFAQGSGAPQGVFNSSESVTTYDNQQYIAGVSHSSSVLIRPFFRDRQGNTTSVCKVSPASAAILVPDTKYFSQMLDAGLHHLKFVDQDDGRTVNPLSFVARMQCSGDGFVRFEGLPSLPYIVSMVIPPELAPANGNRLIAHIQLSPNKLTEVELSNANVVGPNDTIKQGVDFDLNALKLAFSKLPRFQPSMEDIAAEQALSAIDRGDLNAAAAATIQYVDACVRVQRCSDTLRQDLTDQFHKNRGWFEFFGTLATLGSAGETVAGRAVAGATEEEIGLNEIGQAFKRASRQTLENGTAVEDGILYTAANGPGPLGLEVAQTFRGLSYTRLITRERMILYRVYGGRAPELGPYWSDVPPYGALQARIDSALKPEWGNTVTKVVKIELPVGTTIYRGAAASQTLPDGSILLGGGNQVYVKAVNPGWIIP